MAETPHAVSDVMTRTVVAVGREATFKEIVETMDRWKVSALPVLEGEGRVIGVVSEADLLPKEEFRGQVPRLDEARRLSQWAKAGAVTADQLMTSPAVTVHEDATLPQAARAMAVRAVKRLPVVDDEAKLVGIVSRADLLKVFLRSDADIEQEVGRLLAAQPPLLLENAAASVAEGVVTLTGDVRDPSLIPVVVRLARSVEGVVDVESRLGSPPPDPPGERT
ncbi:CBS domain-containing protein [Streptomyces palmae]|uniref:CBS domain-containing protein n=1 Tax=Streptomyces palmae TaxID=1701085 RepID=A0A4Z0HGN0_9ACTN|nr:CBS domain-containing protein [Streptomyces palmae]TGB18624.1 CBS domain-containing protein [Streptomyces palmae]